MEITEHLDKGRKTIDRLIEEFIPKKIDEKYLEHILGKPLYKYDAEVFQKTAINPIWDLLERGGKRWRPWMYFTLIRCFGGDYEKYKNLGVVIEIVHNGSLVADDIEDRTRIRRGKKAIHLIYGVDVAINLSSLMYFLPTKILNTLDIDDDTFRRLTTVFNEELTRVHIGQAMDIGWHAGIKDPTKISIDEYLQMCANKTGVLPRLACKWAAIVSGLNDAEVKRIGRVGESIGVAFQIQDDIMNLKMSEGLGKEFAEDITEGKKTLMIIYLLQNGSEEDKKRVIEILNKHTNSVDDKKEVIRILEKYNAFEFAHKIAAEIVENAWSDAEDILPDNEYKRLLHQLAIFCVKRDR